MTYYAREPVNTIDHLGTENAGDRVSLTFDQRRGRCYELAGYALAFGTAPYGTLLVHGSWTGPVPKERIGHAWLILPPDSDHPAPRVWEPIRYRVYDRDEFYEWTKAWDEATYALPVLRRHIATSGHFGRWHQSRYR